MVADRALYRGQPPKISSAVYPLRVNRVQDRLIEYAESPTIGSTPTRATPGATDIGPVCAKLSPSAGKATFWSSPKSIASAASHEVDFQQNLQVKRKGLLHG